jgi:1-acyl-sn-glycerol-3-phosphate acyltransferase
MSRLTYSRFAWRVMDLALGPRMKLAVHRLFLAGLPRELDEDLPLLLVANHTSWWDGFLIRKAQEQIRREDDFHPVMLDQELRKRPFLRLLGAQGLTPGSSASFRRLLRRFQARREHSGDFTVLFFPQGRIWPSHRRPLGFQPGIRLVAEALAPATTLPLALHIQPGRYPAPLAFLSFGEPIRGDGSPPTGEELEDRVARELDAIHHFLARHGEECENRWPDPHQSLHRPDGGTLANRGEGIPPAMRRGGCSGTPSPTPPDNGL